MNNWHYYSTFILLALLIVTLTPSTRRHRVAVILYTLVAILSVVLWGIRPFLSLRMADAFGPRHIDPIAYLILAVPFLIALAPALLLYPWISQPRSRVIALCLFGVAIAIEVLSSAYVQTSLVLCLLWLRIDDMRRVLAENRSLPLQTRNEDSPSVRHS